MPSFSKRITVLVVDHNPILLGGIKSLIENESGLCLAGAAENVTEAWELFLSKRPRVVLIDLDLPDSSALQVIRSVRGIQANVPIIGMATYEFDRIGPKALAGGAQAVIYKERLGEDLIRAIRQVCEL